MFASILVLLLKPMILNCILYKLLLNLQQPGQSASPARTGTLQTRAVTASQLATDSPAKMHNGVYHDTVTSQY